MATGHTSFWQQYESLEDELSSLDWPTLAKADDKAGEQSRYQPSNATSSLSHQTSAPQMTSCDDQGDSVSKKSQLRAEIRSFQKAIEPFYASGVPPPVVLLSTPVHGADWDNQVAKLQQLCLDHQEADKSLKPIPNSVDTDSKSDGQDQIADSQVRHAMIPSSLETTISARTARKVEPYSKMRLNFHPETNIVNIGSLKLKAMGAKNQVLPEPKTIGAVLNEVRDSIEKMPMDNNPKSTEGTGLLPVNMASKLLCSIVIKALDDIIDIFQQAKKPSRADSYNEVINKIKSAKLTIEPPGPLVEMPFVQERGINNHICELALKAAQQLDPTAKWEDIQLSTTKVRSCRLQALAGLSLLYSSSNYTPDWDLLARLWLDAKFTTKKETSITFLESIITAKVTLAARQDKVIKEAAKPCNSALDEVQKVDKRILLNVEKSCSSSSPLNRYTADCLQQANPVTLDKKGYLQWVYLNYQVGSATIRQFCQQLAARHYNRQKIKKSDRFNTNKQKLTASSLTKIVVPNLVHDIIHGKISRDLYLGQQGLKEIVKCPHELGTNSPSWKDAQGAISPTFSAIIFLGESTKIETMPIMVINHRKVSQWMLELKAHLGTQSSLDPFLNVNDMAAVLPVVSQDNVHKIEIHSVGASSALCSGRLHEARKWVDNQLPIHISTCQLSQIDFLDKPYL